MFKNKVKIKYSKVEDSKRLQLIDMFYMKNYLLKDAARTLGINYSTAKTIVRVYRQEDRIKKKYSNSDEKKIIQKSGETLEIHKTKPSEIDISKSYERKLIQNEPLNNNMVLLDDTVKLYIEEILKLLSEFVKTQKLIQEIMKLLENDLFAKLPENMKQNINEFYKSLGPNCG